TSSASTMAPMTRSTSRSQLTASPKRLSVTSRGRASLSTATPLMSTRQEALLTRRMTLGSSPAVPTLPSAEASAPLKSTSKVGLGLAKRSTLQPVIEGSAGPLVTSTAGRSLEDFLVRYPVGISPANDLERAMAILTGLIRDIRDGQKTKGLPTMPKDWALKFRTSLNLIADTDDKKKTGNQDKTTMTDVPESPPRAVDELPELIATPVERQSTGNVGEVARSSLVEAQPAPQSPGKQLSPGPTKEEVEELTHMTELILEANNKLLLKLNA
uniref:Uncharacterized protein n=1 Tax=Anopheles funestus TaxID=62324 RepID=A0A182RET1_ANOFN